MLHVNTIQQHLAATVNFTTPLFQAAHCNGIAVESMIQDHFVCLSAYVYYMTQLMKTTHPSYILG